MAPPDKPLSDGRAGGASFPAAAHSLPPAAFGFSSVLLILLCSVAALLTISSQSLWIDEALTAMKAEQPTVGGWWRALVSEKASDLQMPLYMIYIWGFAKIFGASEWALRAANLPWFLAGVLALAAAARGRNARWTFLALTAATSPFCWSYLNEARPYAMQLGASFLIVAALGRLGGADADTRQDRRWTAGLAAGIGVLGGSSLLGLGWSLVALAVVWWLAPGSRRPAWWRQSRSVWLPLGAWLVALGLYYLWTLRLGARASAAAGTSVKGLVFVGYELLGFSGLGPGRLALREAGPAALRGYELRLGLYALIVLSILVAGVRAVGENGRGRSALAIAAALLGGSAVLVLAGWIAHFRLLGRHFAPLAAGLIVLFSLGAARLWSSKNWLARAAVLGFFGLTVCSSLSLRFAPRHYRDDYRGAAALARTALADHRTVWWNADPQGAAYYRLPTADDARQPTAARWLVNPRAGALDALPRPDVVVTSKPDLYDAEGTLARYLQHGGFARTHALPAFVVWERKAD